MKLSQVLSERKRLAIAVGDDVLNVVYRPKAITPEMVDGSITAAQLAKSGALNADSLTIENADEKFGMVLRMSAMPVDSVLAYVESWDLTDEEGVTIPLSRESLRTLPIEFLKTVVAAINEDMRPNPTKVKPSHETSSLAA